MPTHGQLDQLSASTYGLLDSFLLCYALYHFAHSLDWSGEWLVIGVEMVTMVWLPSFAGVLEATIN